MGFLRFVFLRSPRRSVQTPVLGAYRAKALLALAREFAEASLR